ncbi:MAG: rRNA pseudouridine synthase [Muribaculaceae bacterium]|nr:rRNA pseudouridine synthase [Muribaculaceae bacterium]
MDENQKKPKRPRIGEANANLDENMENGRYEKVEYNAHEPHQSADDNNSPEDYQQQEGYQPRQQGYHRPGYQPRQGGYQPRYQQRQGGYQQRQGGYQPRYQQRYPQQQAAGEQDVNAEGAPMNPDQQQGGYQPRQGGYQQRQGGYQPRQGGYQPRQGGYQQRQGGYQPRQGGYQQRQGGYQQRQGGYQQRQGGYQQRQGGYQQRQGGYQQRQGGYQQRPGGYQQRPRRQGPKPQMRFTPKPQRVIYEEPAIDPNMEVRLNKFMANAGICSRRVADEYIQKGLVKVNGEVVTELGMKITPKDIVEYNGEVVTTEKKCYILLNKPKDCVTTSDDPNGRKTVMDLVKGACEERIYPVGRLDRNTTGVLLLTNDGDLAAKLAHPQYVKKKIYQVWTDKPISEEDMQHIADGVELDDGPIHADAVSYVSPTDRKQAGIEIHSGRNRVVRRIFEALGYHVVKLDRVYFAGLTKKNLPRGRWRYLTQEEVNFLKQNSFE